MTWRGRTLTVMSDDSTDTRSWTAVYRLPPDQAASVLRQQFGDDLRDVYTVDGVIVMVFERYYLRNGQRASLTAVLSPAGAGASRVHAVGSGGGGFWGFDWGTGSDFASLAADALSSYIVPG